MREQRGHSQFEQVIDRENGENGIRILHFVLLRPLVAILRSRESTLSGTLSGDFTRHLPSVRETKERALRSRNSFRLRGGREEGGSSEQSRGSAVRSVIRIGNPRVAARVVVSARARARARATATRPSQ
jgi:hypothetical protein